MNVPNHEEFFYLIPANSSDISGGTDDWALSVVRDHSAMKMVPYCDFVTELVVLLSPVVS